MSFTCLRREKFKKLRVLLTRTLQDFAIKELQKHYKIEIHSGPFPMSKKKLLSRIKEQDGLICFPYDNIDKDVIQAGTKLKTISAFSVGYDQIDVKYAKKRKIKIGYTPNVLTVATADLTITLILDLLRRVTEGDRLIRQGKWKEVFGADTYVGEEIDGKILGILGFGRIGRAVAKKAHTFGINVMYHKRNRLSSSQEMALGVKFVTLNELFSKSDIISIHIPYSTKTHELVNKSLIKKMKKRAFLVNTSRGKIINECDLVDALKRKIIAGALDVFYHEPIGKNHPLTKMQNVVLSPHLGSSSISTRTKMAKITVKNLKLGLSGKKPIYSV
jgi:glyoxylate reductase